MSTSAAVIGCGVISHEHLGYLRGAPHVDLVGVCDTSPAAVAFARSRYAARAGFTDVGALLAEARPQVVHVLTPPQTHRPLVERCLAAGCHVICEKPIAATAADLEPMLAAANAAGLRLMESQNLLFNQPVLEIDRARAAGRLGAVREVDVLLALDLLAGRFGDPNLSGPGVDLPGGAVHDFLPHLAYLFLHFAGAPVELAVGRLRNASGSRRVGFDELDALVVAGPVRGRLRIACDLRPDAFRLTVRGSAGSIETDLYHPYQRVEGGANVGARVALEHLGSGVKLAWSGVQNLRAKVLGLGVYHGLHRMLDAFYAALRDDRPQPISTDAMLGSARLIDRLIALQEPA